jgi:DNA/RNA-binding domain of Phe-tRNA-synthetase-like protein
MAADAPTRWLCGRWGWVSLFGISRGGSTPIFRPRGLILHDMRWLIENRIPDRVQVAWFLLRDAAVRESRPELEAEIAARSEALRAAYADPASAAGALAPSRRLYHRLGLDPSKVRPSSEALVRRILQGKGLFQVNTAVDAANLGSITHFRSVGLYDADRIVPFADRPAEGARGDSETAPETLRVVMRLGAEAEEYPGIRKEMIHVANRPTLADREGPFGNPSADSDRTKVTLETQTLLYVLFEPPDEPAPQVAERLELSFRLLQRHLGGTR